jgi:hypothetical protein
VDVNTVELSKASWQSEAVNNLRVKQSLAKAKARRKKEA